MKITDRIIEIIAADDFAHEESRPTFIALEVNGREVTTVLTTRAELHQRKAIAPQNRPTRILLDAPLGRLFLCRYCMSRPVRYEGDHCEPCAARDLTYWRGRRKTGGFTLRRHLLVALAVGAILYEVIRRLG